MGQVGRPLSSSLPALSGSRHSTSESVSAAKLTAACLAGPYCCCGTAAPPPAHSGSLSLHGMRYFIFESPACIIVLLETIRGRYQANALRTASIPALPGCLVTGRSPAVFAERSGILAQTCKSDTTCEQFAVCVECYVRYQLPERVHLHTHTFIFGSHTWLDGCP